MHDCTGELKMASKQAQSLVKTIRSNKSTVYCARVDADSVQGVNEIATTVAAECPETILLLYSTPNNTTLLVVQWWSTHLRNKYSDWTALNMNGVEYAKLSYTQADDGSMQSYAYTFAANAERDAYKVADQMSGNAMAQLRKWQLLADEEDEHEYNFDDVE